MKLTTEETLFVKKLFDSYKQFVNTNQLLADFEEEVKKLLQVINFDFNQIIFSPKLFFTQSILNQKFDMNQNDAEVKFKIFFERFFAELKTMSQFKGLRISPKYNLYRDSLMSETE